MKTIWILILLYNSPSGGSLQKVEFNNLKACERAGEKTVNNFNQYIPVIINIKYVCVEKS